MKANEANLSQPGDPQPQEEILTPLFRKTTLKANLKVASGATPFQIELMNVAQASQSKEMDKSDIEMTTLSVDTHSTKPS